LAAQLTEATARSLVRSGVLGPTPVGGFTIADVLALKVAATVAGVVLPGETRPANVIRDPLPREAAAVQAVRELAAAHVPEGAVLLVFPTTAVVATTPAALAATVLSSGPEPYLVLPVGQWLAQLTPAPPAVEVA
jgi:hypothetical protein